MSRLHLKIVAACAGPGVSGFQVEDTEAFASRVQRAMAKTLSLNSMELLEEADIPDEVQ